MSHRYCMTLKEIKESSMVAGMEGLGGYHWEFDPDLFAENLVTEIVKWAKTMIGMSPYDEAALREHLEMTNVR